MSAVDDPGRLAAERRARVSSTSSSKTDGSLFIPYAEADKPRELVAQGRELIGASSYHLIRTDRVPPEHVQQALILNDYCVLLSETLAQIIAGQWLAHRTSASEREFELAPHADAEPALQLAQAVEDMARNLADPERTRREQRRLLTAVFTAPALSDLSRAGRSRVRL